MKHVLPLLAGIALAVGRGTILASATAGYASDERNPVRASVSCHVGDPRMCSLCRSEAVFGCGRAS